MAEARISVKKQAALNLYSSKINVRDLKIAHHTLVQGSYNVWRRQYISIQSRYLYIIIVSGLFSTFATCIIYSEVYAYCLFIS